MIRALIFTTKTGDRFIVPTFCYTDGDPDASPANVIIDGMMFRVVTGCLPKTEWLEVSAEADGFVTLLHVRTMMTGPQFAHGGCTVLLIDGPEFDIASGFDFHVGDDSPEPAFGREDHD